jgi:hypothetical protein
MIAAALFGLCLGIPPDEDAFIYFRYALQWAVGHGLVFNPGERVEGFSSPTWMAVVAFGARLGVVPHVFARAAGLLCGALAVAATAWLARRLAAGRLAAGCAAAALALDYWFLHWSQSGLETPLYALLVVLAAGTGARVLDGDHGAGGDVTAGVFFGLAALSRPEGVLLAPAFLALTWWRELPRRRLQRLALPALLPLLALALWRRVTFHAWLPNTSVKLYTLRVDRSLEQALDFMAYAGIVAIILPAIACVVLRRHGRAVPGHAALWVLVMGSAALFQALAGGDYRAGYRYLMPALPPAIAWSWWALHVLAGGWSRPARAAAGAGLLVSLVAGSGREWRADAAALCLPQTALACWSDPFNPPLGREATRGAWAWDESRFGGEWILEHVPQGSLVAFGQMGKAPYLQLLRGRDVRFFDTIGLVNRDIADVYRIDRKLRDAAAALLHGESLSDALARGRDERARRFVDVLLAARPDFILVERNLPHVGLQELLPRDPRFRRDYAQVDAVGPEGLVRVYRRGPLS